MIINKNTPKLTIGYATHCRKQFIINRLKTINTLKIPTEVEIIVIDNASTDGTYEAIKGLTDSTNIKVYSNNKNLGFSGNFIEVLKRARGDYVLWSSDEDEINLKGIESFFKWIEDKDLDAIFLNHYQKINSKKFIATRKNRSRLLYQDDLWGGCHLPGVVWNKKVALQSVRDWDKLKIRFPQVSKYYPNLMILIRILPNYNSYFYNEFITYQVEYTKSQHISKPGFQYHHLNPRWLQHNELLDFISSCIKLEKNPIRIKYFQKIKKTLNENLYSFLSEAIRQENPNLYSHFIRSHTPIYLIKRWYKLIKLVCKSFLDDPEIAIQRIKKRLKALYVDHKKT